MTSIKDRIKDDKKYTFSPLVISDKTGETTTYRTRVIDGVTLKTFLENDFIFPNLLNETPFILLLEYKIANYTYFTTIEECKTREIEPCKKY